MHKGAILILAAGNSSRLGRSKQLVETAKGNTLLNQTINTAEESQLGEIYVVLGSDYQKHAESIYADVHLIENDHWSAGMGSSVKAGISRIMSDKSQVEFIIVSVCDQPHLQVENFSALFKRFKEVGKSIVASRYEEGFGVPVLFSREFFSDLLQLGDSEGALKLLKTNLDKVAFVDFKMGNVDIDTPDDLLKHLPD